MQLPLSPSYMSLISFSNFLSDQKPKHSVQTEDKDKKLGHGESVYETMKERLQMRKNGNDPYTKKIAGWFRPDSPRKTYSPEEPDRAAVAFLNMQWKTRT